MKQTKNSTQHEFLAQCFVNDSISQLCVVYVWVSVCVCVCAGHVCVLYHTYM